MVGVVYNATIAALYRRHKETAAMKTNDPRPRPTLARMTPAQQSRASRSSHCHPAAAAGGQAAAPAAPVAKTEVGYTLQTLIVTAVFVLAAVGVGIGLLAINSSSSDNFEEAGQTGVEKRCAPNEVRDPDLEARGVNGINKEYRGTTYGGDGSYRSDGSRIVAKYRADQEIVADNIGCNPICGTWEYFSPGLAGAGSGGPDGSGGVYSTAKGCFAPCYWGRPSGGRVNHPQVNQVRSTDARLRYFDDNRAPIAREHRLGVNYRRSVDPTAPVPTDSSNIFRGLQQQQDLVLYTIGGNKDGKPFINARWNGRIDGVGGSWTVAGTLPLSPRQLAAGFPTVFKPNWKSNSTDPGTDNRNNGTHNWQDENWEVRADPYNKVCTIVNTTLDDEVVCSSEWDRCRNP